MTHAVGCTVAEYGRALIPGARGCEVHAVGAPPPLHAFTDIAFTDSTHGWVLDQPCKGGDVPQRVCPGSIEATTNGGLTWWTQYKGLVSSDLDAVDDDHVAVVATPAACQGGWAANCSTDVLATDDGGRSWSIDYQTSGQITGMHFASPQVGWVTDQYCYQNELSTCSSRIVGTVDGGATWTTQYQTTQTLLTVSSHDGIAWVVAVANAPPMTFAPGLELLRSSVSGGTWAPFEDVGVGAAEADGSSTAALAFSGQDQVLLNVFTQDTCAIHGCEDSLYRSEDGGSTWDLDNPGTGSDVAASGQFGIGQPGDGCGTTAPFSFATDPDGTMYVGVAADGNCPLEPSIMISTRDGSPWALGSQWSDTYLNGIAWPAVGDGWATTGVAIIHTGDGLHWSQVVPPIHPTESLAVGTGGALWGTGTVSDPGAILVSHDGGRSWSVTAQMPGWAQYINVVRGHLWVVDQVDDQWTISSSTEGTNFELLCRVPILTQSITDPTRPAGFDQVDGLFMFGRTGVLVGEDSFYLRVERTSDGGRTWGHAMNRRLGSPPEFATFGSDRHGWTEEYVPGGRGDTEGSSVLATTDDGGFSWSLVKTLPSGFSLGGTVALQAEVGWVFGTYEDAGTLAVSQDGGHRWRFLHLPVQLTPSATSALNAFASGLVLARSGRAWMLTSSGVWTTVNGGQTWSLL